jgi:hypothetical protein
MEARYVFQSKLPTDIKLLIYKSLWQHVYPISSDLKIDIQSFKLIDSCLKIYEMLYINPHNPNEYLEMLLFDLVTYNTSKIFVMMNENALLEFLSYIYQNNTLRHIRLIWAKMSHISRVTFVATLQTYVGEIVFSS